jgi:hypothetical protein
MSIVHRLSDSLGRGVDRFPNPHPSSADALASLPAFRRHVTRSTAPTRAPLLSNSLEVAMDRLLSSQPMEGSSSSWIPTPRVSSTRAWTWAERFQSLATPHVRPSSPETRSSCRRLKGPRPMLTTGTPAAAHQVSTAPDRRKPRGGARPFDDLVRRRRARRELGNARVMP